MAKTPEKDMLLIEVEKTRQRKKKQFDENNARNQARIKEPQFGKSWNDKMREMYPHLYSSK